MTDKLTPKQKRELLETNLAGLIARAYGRAKSTEDDLEYARDFISAHEIEIKKEPLPPRGVSNTKP